MKPSSSWPSHICSKCQIEFPVIFSFTQGISFFLNISDAWCVPSKTYREHFTHSIARNFFYIITNTIFCILESRQIVDSFYSVSPLLLGLYLKGRRRLQPDLVEDLAREQLARRGHPAAPQRQCHREH